MVILMVILISHVNVIVQENLCVAVQSNEEKRKRDVACEAKGGRKE